MSTDAVQPEIDALTRLKEAGTILAFEFRGHPSPRFEVVLALEWDEATLGWAKEGKAREAALDKAMNDLQWRFDEHVERDNEDGTERWAYTFHGEAEPTIPGGHYRCVDASRHDGEHWDIQADTPKGAARSFVGDGDFEPRSQTFWVHVRVRSPDGDESTHKIEVKPVAPPCTSQGGHLWLDPCYRANGAGVLVEETCDHCGLKKHIDTDGRDLVDGSMATVTSYKAG